MVYVNYLKLMENPPLVGVIGGSGLYKLDNFKIEQTIDVTTPWGKPSSPITIATLSRPDQPGQDVSVAFIARHSPNHSITPSNVPARANIAALKHLGVHAIVAFSAVGSLREEVRPGDLIVPDQIIDRTKGIRPSTFFDSSLVGHAMFGEPFSVALSQFLLPHIQSAIDSFTSNVQHGDTKPRLHSEKTLIVMEGPQFSTRAESNVYRQWGGDIINMSTIPEAKLAREAEINYALVCTSTDYDAWRVGHAPVTVEEVMKTLSTNASLSKHITAEILGKVHDALAKGEIESAKGGMRWSLMTRHEFVKQEDLNRYRYILPEYFGGEGEEEVVVKNLVKGV
ncbi:BQ2448_7862 [Microbotryum intermedium]|uniref:S-methyl-5'-thioadenosine phosphorylase n=1 Tax=Microbotryum intermedium TaxID=269621 RepID=A0A238FS93_9BASI|nr:BQ2448_7862 [Microbotryum intermedium]